MQNEKTKIKILLVEDDPTLAKLLKLALEDIVDLAVSGDQSVLNDLQKMKWDLIILDIFLPKVNGLEILRKLRSNGTSSPVIIISGRATARNQILSFENGANLFLPKPINLALLRTQILSLSKRLKKTLRIGNLLIYPNQGIITTTDRGATNLSYVKLTKKEIVILTKLIEADGEIVTREKLVELCNPRNLDLNFNSIDTSISRLRNKLSPIGGQEIVETVYGSGYRFRKPLTT